LHKYKPYVCVTFSKFHTRSEMKKNAMLLVLFIALLHPLSAQRSAKAKDEKRFVDKLFVGGTLGLMFGDITRIDVEPIAGIWVVPQWSLGLGGRYGYFSQRGTYLAGGRQVFRSHLWGVSAFTQILPIPNLSDVTPIDVKGGIIFHGGYEALYLDQKLTEPFSSTETGKTWVHLFLAGAGYRQQLGERAAINILFLWNLRPSSYSPYTSTPIIRVNVTF
jgi:hypothetical protein